MLDLIDEKALTVIFANIEDILLTATSFLSSLEQRQKSCRLYIDVVGDILEEHIPMMRVYMVSPSSISVSISTFLSSTTYHLPPTSLYQVTFLFIVPTARLVVWIQITFHGYIVQGRSAYCYREDGPMGIDSWLMFGRPIA